MTCDNEPKLLLFLSADLLNATALKNVFSDETQVLHWKNFIEGFHDGFPISLTKFFIHKKAPEIWKSLGDELVFCLELENAKQAFSTVVAFWHTLREFNDKTANKIKIEQKMNFDCPKKLGVKGTAWVANFPYPNTQVQISKINKPDIIHDLIGPQIDIGFRLTKFADRRKLSVSVELASLMVESTPEIKFFYDGRQTLKGVMNNQPYPIIWVSLNEKLGEIDDALYNQCEAKHIKEFCSKLFKDPSNSLQRPFIKGDPDFLVPKDYKEKIKKDCQENERFQSGFGKEEEEYLPLFGPAKIITVSDWMS